MGGVCSHKYIVGTSDAVVAILMPLYYTKDAEIGVAEIKEAKTSWELITNDASEAFQYMKLNDPNFTHCSCMTWFFSSFYDRLFDVHPLCKSLFKAGLKGQGKFLVNMISLTLNQLENPSEFAITMHDLTIRHCERGVKAIEYGVVGEVLFWSIKTCIGLKCYTNEVHDSWTKIYSKMLQVIVPVAVQYERLGIHQSAIVRSKYVTKDNTENNNKAFNSSAMTKSMSESEGPDSSMLIDDV